MAEQTSTFLYHEPCENCGSSDAKAVYDNGTAFCFSCDHNFPNVETTKKQIQKTLPSTLKSGKYLSVPSRNLSVETCQKFGYTTMSGEQGWIANYRNTDGLIVAQKLRTPDKSFTVKGDGKNLTFFGQHLWNKGNKLVITEGEIDAMSVSQIQNHKWAVVSLPQGAAGAKRSIKNNWDYLQNFQEIILMFDMDKAGQTAAKEVAELLPLGKAKIAGLPLKDANECLCNGKTKEVIDAIWQAREYRPDGIVSATDLRSEITKVDEVSSITYPYEMINSVTRGLRRGELVTITSGSGMGKTTFCSELALHLHKSGERLGMIMLEESNKKTLRNLIGIHTNTNLTVNQDALSKEQVEEAFDELFMEENQIYLYDHFGSTDIDTICNRIMYLNRVLDVNWVILDHISIMISGLVTNDERKLIDMAMTKLRTLVQETGIGLILVSHLRRPEGNKGHEDGVAPKLNALRGSHAIAQLSDICIGLGVDPENPNSNVRQLSILKNRFTGQTGFAGNIVYNADTGRLLDQQAIF